MCGDIEYACDEKVIKGETEGARADYCKALLTCSVPRKMIAACPVAFGENGVKGRVKNMMNYKKPTFWISSISLVIVVIVAVCFATSPEGKEADNEKTAPAANSEMETVQRREQIRAERRGKRSGKRLRKELPGNRRF